MKWTATSLCYAMVLATSGALVATSVPAQQMNCEIGPVAKTYGSTQWLVYSCDDTKSVVVLSAPGNPAMPFYFIFSPEGAGHRLQGEGTGNKNSTASAFNDLKRLSESDILGLINETKTVRDASTR